MRDEIMIVAFVALRILSLIRPSLIIIILTRILTNTIIYLASVNGYSVIGQSGVLFLVHMLHIAKRGRKHDTPEIGKNTSPMCLTA